MNTDPTSFVNPFRPGAGHPPPFLAGRHHEDREFRSLLAQTLILKNLVLTGLRGIGKTVLLDSFRPTAFNEHWLWVGTDLSESASVSEEHLALRIITDLSVVTRNIYFGTKKQQPIGFTGAEKSQDITLGYEHLTGLFKATPGLVSDKLKAVLLHVAPYVQRSSKKGIVFAYDEAQNLADHEADKQYPLSLLLEVFQSMQKQQLPYMLVLAGLPTLVQKLIEARTYAERMFQILSLQRLSIAASREAIVKPISSAKCPVQFSESGIDTIVKYSGGYPYFIQFMCRECYDAWLQGGAKDRSPTVPYAEIIRKLDNDFFVGRWAKATDRQQQLLYVVAHLSTANDEFTIKQIMDLADRKLHKSFGKSQINQMLVVLIANGLIYKDRHGKYVFAVPLMADFIKRTMDDAGIVPADGA